MTWIPFRHESSSKSGTDYAPPAGPPQYDYNYSAEQQQGFAHPQAQNIPPPEYSAERNHFPSGRWRLQESHNPPAQQQNFAPPSQYNGPREGFTNLPPRFYMWCRGGDTTISMGAQPSGMMAYSAHFSPSPTSRTTFAESSGRVIAESSKQSDWNPATTLHFQGYRTELTEAPPCYRFQAPVRGGGRVDGFEWRPWHARGLKSMVLLPQGAPSDGGTALATWIASGAGVSLGGGDLGFFEFAGPTMTGAMGDVFMALAIMSVARIYHGEYERTPNMNMYGWNAAGGMPAHGASAWHMAGGGVPAAGMYQNVSRQDDEEREREKEKERKRKKKKKKDEDIAVMAAIACI